MESMAKRTEHGVRKCLQADSRKSKLACTAALWYEILPSDIRKAELVMQATKLIYEQICKISGTYIF